MLRFYRSPSAQPSDFPVHRARIVLTCAARDFA